VLKADENVTNLVKVWEIKGQQSVNSKDWKKGTIILKAFRCIEKSIQVHFSFLIILGVVPITNLINDYTIVIEAQIGTQISFGDIRLI